MTEREREGERACARETASKKMVKFCVVAFFSLSLFFFGEWASFYANALHIAILAGDGC